MKRVFLLVVLLLTVSVSQVLAVVYTGVMDNRAGQQFIPGMTAQSKAWTSGGNPGEGVRLEWQVDNVNTPGSWTYTYRLLRGTENNKGFAFFDIETATDFTAANILTKQVTWAFDRLGNTIPSGIAAITISDPVNFNAVHDFSNAAVTEADVATALNKSELSHYSGDPGRVPPGLPGRDASSTPSVGPVPHPFFGIRVTFPGSFTNLAYEASEWEFKIVSDRPPTWGSFFGWGDQTKISPYWYSNMYNDNIDNPARLTLPPASCNFGESPCQGWILVPGPLPSAQSSFLTVDLASYSRDAGGAGQINMFATALPNPNLTLTVSGTGIAAPVVMTPDTPHPIRFGKYLAHIPYTTLPAAVNLVNSFDPVSISPYSIPLVDEVNITQAVFNPLTRVMTIKAASRDRMAPLPTLTAVDFAAPNQFDATGTFTKTLTANPPNNVTVISSKGGSATAAVSVVVPPAAPVAVADAATTNFNTPVTVSVLANDTTAGSLDPASVQISTPSADGLAVPTPGGTVVFMPKAGFSGSTTFTYTVKDTLGQSSAAATVTVTVAAPPGTLTITAAAGPNGAISPAGATTVAFGASQAYTITPNPGFTVSALVVDGTMLPGATSYTFANVTVDHYINAYFEALPATVTISAAAAPNGTISPAGATAVAGGASQAFVITPNAGFTVTALVVDGTLLPGATSYTFTNVTADHYINAYFGPVPATVTITAAAGPNGTISPAGANVVAGGSNQTFTITPNAGFTVTALVVDGALLPGATTYTFTNVTADHYINAYFGP
jgi:Big-like domain-containing protein